MPYQIRTPARRGIITGFVFKLLRESIPASQEQLAAVLDVDRTTVQSWESGRRPLTSVALGQAVAIRSTLARLGADMNLLAVLNDAAEADCLLGEVLDSAPEKDRPGQHPLGWSVLTHSLTDLIVWAVAGQTPATVARRSRTPSRRGPVPAGPLLETAEKQIFFTNLQIIADRTGRRGDDRLLLHRQACFLASLDPTGSTADWLPEATSANPSPATFRTWSPLWADGRSMATSRAKQGDPQLLRDFIARAHPDDICERAGLNYWAYWVGEIRHRQRDDFFMTDPDQTWRGGTLLRHLTDRLRPGHPFIDLNIHSLWALLAARHGLAYDDPGTGREILIRGENILDAADISTQSRQELAAILYGLRIGGLTSKGCAQ
jgi:DNA-binding XRE family transcriptional regulator